MCSNSIPMFKVSIDSTFKKRKKISPIKILLFLFTVVATDDKDSLERGVFLHEKTKILLAEKFVNAQFLVL